LERQQGEKPFVCKQKEHAMQAKSNFIIPLSDPSAGHAQVGGKGASLRRLAAAGFPVPDGFHVTTAAYTQFVAANRLEVEITASLATLNPTQPASLEIAALRIQAAFEAGHMPEAIASEIAAAYIALGNPPVAVRSSATAEDLPKASFAGQQETYLNMRGEAMVLDAVKRCWGSLWTARAITYRSRQGISPDTVAIAVVVQKLVLADAAGILFTADPVSGQRDRVLISASWGLGEAVVGGLVTPDSLTVDKSSGRVLNRQTADKQVMTVRTASTTEEQSVPEALRKAPVLDDTAAAQLTALGVQIEQLYSQPMDIEWAMVGSQFFILQARPITALPTIETVTPITWPKPPRGVMYGRTSFAEQIPNPVSPLFATLGLRMADIPTQELMRWFTRAKVNYAYVPVNGYVFMVAGLSFPELVAYMRMSAKIMVMVFHAQEHCPAARQKFVQVIQEWEAKDVASLSPSELLMGAGIVFQESVRLYTHIQAGTVPLSTFSEGIFTQFYNRLVRRKGDPAATTFLFGSETVALRAEKALFNLAAWCRERPTLAEYLRQTPASQVAQALSQPKPPAILSLEIWTTWQAQLQAYLAEHGKMTYDLDFVNPVPAEQPTALLETIRMYLQDGGSDPYARHQAILERRKQATAAVLDRLHWPLKGWFQGLLRWAQKAAPGREDSLADLGLGHPTIRRYLNELGRRLAEGGAIPDAASIYWLEEAEVQELIKALDADQPLSDLSGLIPPRRAERQRFLKVTPPAILPEKSSWSVLVPWHRTSDDQSTLHGIGTSAGQVTARASVLFGPEDFPHMRPGDVLVAVTTTPAWTPLFAMASAVVTDIGGPLSHSSIVAREYGIPAVMAAGNATRRIQNGQILTVDGSAGIVTLKE
jgi:phosphohistidine swiveling domain-containing protein